MTPMKKVFLLILFAHGVFLAGYAQIGIGTTTPSSSAILDIKSSTKGMILPRTSTTTRQAMTGVKGLTVYDTTASQIFYHNGSSWLNVATGTFNNYWSPVGNNIYSNNSGNVGVGTPFPFAKLQVEGDFRVQNGQIDLISDEPEVQIFGSVDANVARLRFALPDDDPDFAITQALGNLYISRNTGAFGFLSDLLVAENGYVGVGAGDPAVRLHVDLGTDVGNASGGYLQLGATNNANIGIDNNEIQGRNNGVVSRLVLNNGGGPVQVGSAISPTGYSLSVNGKVICEELKIQASSNWPDYVFTDEYKLPSFEDLRQYIQANHHLPNIPSAQQVEQDGMMIGDMQKKMMEKIEELTLYVLQLEEKCTQMKSELEELKSKQ
jgi:hypothetical protein